MFLGFLQYFQISSPGNQAYSSVFFYKISSAVIILQYSSFILLFTTRNSYFIQNVLLMLPLNCRRDAYWMGRWLSTTSKWMSTTGSSTTTSWPTLFTGMLCATQPHSPLYCVFKWILSTLLRPSLLRTFGSSAISTYVLVVFKYRCCPWANLFDTNISKDQIHPSNLGVDDPMNIWVMVDYGTSKLPKCVRNYF